MNLGAVVNLLQGIGRCTRTLAGLLSTMLLCSFIRHRRSRSLAAENLFLRKQLALFRERDVKPRRADDATRAALVWLSKAFDWRDALVIVKPATLIAWHRKGFRLLWKLKSRAGRPALPAELRALIRRMAVENVTWGEERIANELLLKLGIGVSPRTVGKYMPRRTVKGPDGWRTDQRWMTFVRNHAESVVACDFFTVVTAMFKVLYVFVVVEHATRRMFPADHSYRFLIRDRDGKFSRPLDESIGRLRLQVLKTPVRAPKANAICERTIGTMRRECLDYLIPPGERHLRRILAEWIVHFNAARPHSALGPGIPSPPIGAPVEIRVSRHSMPAGARVTARPILAGLHHEYAIKQAA